MIILLSFTYTFIYIFLYNVGDSIANEDTCAYTFNISASECSVAPAIYDQLDFLRAIVLNQQSTIQNQQSQLALLTDRILAIENPEETTETPTISGVGSTYVRWGRTECPNTAQLLYHGYAGKAYHTHTGGGVDYQCLPDDPEWPIGVIEGFQSHAYIYGVEYHSSASDFWSYDIHDEDVPCAVCNVNGRGRQRMIPAKLSCPHDWTLEYSGLLATERYNNKGATYVCVDSHMEALHGGSGNMHSGLLYVVEAKCGTLQCPPYHDGYEIACAVCTY